MDNLDGTPQLREHTVQDGPPPSQQHTAKDAAAPEHGMLPSPQLPVTVTDAIKARRVLYPWTITEIKGDISLLNVLSCLCLTS